MLRQMRGLFGLCIMVLVVSLVGQKVASAQTGTTSLRGTILDKSGAAIAGAKVTIANSEQGFERSVTSGETRAYEFLGLAPGVYSLRVEKDSFRKYELSNVQFNTKTPKRQKITFHLSSSP